MKNFTTTTTTKNNEYKPLTLEKLTNALEILQQIPPHIVKIECSEKTFDLLMQKLQVKQLRKNDLCGGGLAFGINIFKNEEIYHGFLNNVYSNGDEKILKIAQWGCQCCGPNQFCEYQYN